MSIGSMPVRPAFMNARSPYAAAASSENVRLRMPKEMVRPGAPLAHAFASNDNGITFFAEGGGAQAQLRPDGSYDYKAPAAGAAAAAPRDGGRVLGEGNFMETPVRWLRDLEAGSCAAKVFAFVLKFLVSLVLGVSIIGLIPLIYGAAEYKRQDFGEGKDLNSRFIIAEAANSRLVRENAQLRKENQGLEAEKSKLQLSVALEKATAAAASEILNGENLATLRATREKNAQLEKANADLRRGIAQASAAKFRAQMGAGAAGRSLDNKEAAPVPAGAPAKKVEPLQLTPAAVLASNLHPAVGLAVQMLGNRMPSMVSSAGAGLSQRASGMISSSSAAGAGAGAAGGITDEEYHRGEMAAKARGGQPPTSNEDIAVRVARELGKSTQEVLAFLNRKEQEGMAQMRGKMPEGVTPEAFVSAMKEIGPEMGKLEASGKRPTEEAIAALLAKKLNITPQVALQVLQAAS